MVYSNSAVAFCHNDLEYDPESELSSEYIFDEYSKYCALNKVPEKDERQFFKSLYKHFGHKVYKKRKRDGNARYFVIVGVCEKHENLSKY